jgi:hypothetical protein
MQSIEHIMWVLTPVQRWSAARRLNTGTASDTWFVLGAGILLVVLVVLLIWVSYRRRVQSPEQAQEIFAEHILRCGLSARERHILQAIVARSGLRRAHDIFATANAFERGAAQLQAECAPIRTPRENASLETEINHLREKMGFAAAPAAADPSGPERPSSRDIPPGKWVELTRRGGGEETALRAKVVRNDEIELAVALPTSLESRVDEPWRVHYGSGMSAWEFDTSTVRCDGERLILDHSQEIRFLSHRNFPRVCLRAPASIAPFPLVQNEVAPAEETPGGDDGGRSDDTDRSWRDAPSATEGFVIESRGPSLRIETSLQAQTGDRVLLRFRLTAGGNDKDNMPETERTVSGVGRVKQCVTTDSGTSLDVELTDLSDAEIDELVDITEAASARTASRDHADDREAKEIAAPATVAT